MRISDWSSDVCSSDLSRRRGRRPASGDRPQLRLRRGTGGLSGHEGGGALRQAGDRDLDRIIVRRNRGAVPPNNVNPIYFKRVEQIHRRSEEHTSELKSLMRISYAVFCLKKNTTHTTTTKT